MMRHLVESARYELAGMRGFVNYSVILGSSQVSLTTRQLATQPLHFSARLHRYRLYPVTHGGLNSAPTGLNRSKID